MRAQLRLIVFSVVAIVVVVTLIAEPPGTVEAVGLAVVLVTMLFLIVRERTRHP
jgi:hypothetical protein